MAWSNKSIHLKNLCQSINLSNSLNYDKRKNSIYFSNWLRISRKSILLEGRLLEVKRNHKQLVAVATHSSAKMNWIIDNDRNKKNRSSVMIMKTIEEQQIADESIFSCIFVFLLTIEMKTDWLKALLTFVFVFSFFVFLTFTATQVHEESRRELFTRKTRYVLYTCILHVTGKERRRVTHLFFSCSFLNIFFFESNSLYTVIVYR